MSLPFLMSVPTIIVICVVSVVAASAIIVGAIVFHKHRFSSASFNLRKQYEDIHFRLTTNCNTSLKRLETLGHYSEDYQNIYEDRKKQYDDILSRKDIPLANEITSLEDMVKGKEYHKVRELETEIANSVNAFNKSVSDFSSDLSTLLQQDDVINSASVPVKAKFRDVENFYTTHVNELKGLEKSFQCIISEAKSRLEHFQNLTNEAKYEDADKSLKELDKILSDTTAVMNQIPFLQASVSTVLPNKLDDLLKTYQEMLSEDYVIRHLRVEERVAKIKAQIAQLKDKLLVLDVEGVHEKVDAIQSEITDINAAFEEEKLAKANYFNTRSAMDDSTYEDERTYSMLMNNLPEYDKVYVLNRKYVDQMMALKNDIENIGILKRQLDSYLDTSSRQPYTVIMKKSSEMRSEMTKCERTMKDYQQYVNSLRQSTEDVYHGLKDCLVDILRMRNEICHLGLKDFLESSDYRINRFLSEIKEINDLIHVLPMDVSKIVSRYNSLHEDCLVFLSDAKKKIEEADKAEQAIVYANAYRLDYTDCDALVKAAEVAYWEGDFSRAYSKACKANTSFNKALSVSNPE